MEKSNPNTFSLKHEIHMRIILRLQALKTRKTLPHLLEYFQKLKTRQLRGVLLKHAFFIKLR